MNIRKFLYFIMYIVLIFTFNRNISAEDSLIDTWKELKYELVENSTIFFDFNSDGASFKISNSKSEWYLLKLSQLPREGRYVIDLGFTDNAQIFTSDSNVKYLGSIGYFIPGRLNPKSQIYPALSPTQFSVVKDSTAYFIRFTSLSPWSDFSPKILSYESWQMNRTSVLLERNITQGLFYGCMLIMFLFNLFIYFIYKDRAYLLYALYIFSLCLSLLPPFELAYSTFLAETPYLIKHLELFGDFGFEIFYFGFIALFLSLKETLPKTFKGIRIFLYIASVGLLISELILLFTKLYYPTQYIYQAVSIVSIVFVLIVFVQIARRKDTLSKYIITGTFFAMLGSASVLYGIIFGSSFPHMEHYLMETGHLIELLTFSIGLGVRYRMIEKERNKFKEIDQLKTRLFENITHEFRTPLTLIISPLENFLRKGGDLSRKTTELILHNARQLLELINQLLDLSKINAGAMQIKSSVVDINTYIRQYGMLFQSLADFKNINYIIDSGDRPLYLNVDLEKFNKILNNVIFNAIKFTPDKGSVTVSTELMGNQVKILVADTGQGIPKDKLPHIFDRFFMNTQSNLPVVEGTGIGLSLTRELVRLHQGEICIESQPGKGTKVIVILPYDKSLSEGLLTESIEIKDIQSINLYKGIIKRHYKRTEGNKSLSETENNDKIALVVEDNPDVRDLIKKGLPQNYKVLLAENGSEGVEMASKYLPDIVVTDLMMPVMDGIEFTHRLKKTLETSHIPVVMLTARGELEDKIAGLDVGADAYMVKPFVFEELNAQISNLLKQRKALRNLFSKNLKAQKEPPQLPEQESKFIRLTNKIIQEHLAEEEFDVEQLSEMLKINRSSLFRKLKSLTGQTPSQYIRIYRINKATQLLKNENMSISEVAFAVGFSNVTYFNKSFKEQFGSTPSDYINIGME